MSGRRPLARHELIERVRTGLAGESGPVTPARVAAALRAGTRPGELVLGDADLLEVFDELAAELMGAGPLQDLLGDDSVTDVLVNGVDGVWVDRGAGLEPVDVRFADLEEVRRLAVRLAALAGRRLDDAVPWVDARLPDGTRLHAVLPPLVQGGAHISLRVPRRQALSLSDLVASGTIPAGWVGVVEALVASRTAYLVTGGTGAGKTTLLASLLALVPPAERLVVVEDAAELMIEHPHVVRLEGRAANVEGVGAVDMAHLVRQALRMRPDRIVVGEVRGAEVRDLLAALNTGHEGGCGTVHANTAADLPARLEALGALAGLDRLAVQAQVASAVQVVLHVRRAGGRRLVEELSVITSGESGPSVVPALRAGATDPGPGWPILASRLELSAHAAVAGR